MLPACDDGRLKAAFAAIGKPAVDCQKGLIGSTATLPPDFPEEQLKKLIQGYADLPHTRAAAGKVKLASLPDDVGEYFWAPKKPDSK